MNAGVSSGHAPGVWDILATLARWLLGGMFIYLGLTKAMHPVEFLKLVRQYDVFHDSLLLNLTAAALPWFEVFCGCLLVLGIAVRGASAMLALMLVAFSAMVLLRALAIREAGQLPFCAIKFDCGCGAGEVFICRKLAENAILLALSFWLTFSRRSWLCVRHAVFPAA
jgi:uncharacterized membrane protein YphA (DoxX/SURF4 family)